MTQSETRRVVKLAGEDGMLTKENFFKIVQGSDFFLKSFDKNNDGEVTEVRKIFHSFYSFSIFNLIQLSDWHHDKSRVSIQCPRWEQKGPLYGKKWPLTYRLCIIQGYITTKDLAKLTKKLSKEEVGALMTKLDTDGDGQLSFDEFKEMLQKELRIE